MLPTAVVPTPQGDATITVDAPAGMPRALLVLGHGAGGTVSSADLVAVTTAAVAAGYAVVRVTQPYRVAGRKAPPRPPVLDEAWLAVLATLSVPGLPLVVGGRSSGARVACRTADRLGAAAVVTLAFPTAPPRTPERDRLAELAAPTVPVLVVQGERDPFGVPPAAPGRTVVLLPGATHTIRGTAASTAATAVLTWLDQVLPQPSGRPAAHLVAADLPGSLSIMPAPPGGPASTARSPPSVPTSWSASCRPTRPPPSTWPTNRPPRTAPASPTGPCRSPTSASRTAPPPNPYWPP